MKRFHKSIKKINNSRKGYRMYILKKTTIILILFMLFPLQKAWSETVIPAKDTVTMVDLGSTSCIPCKLMEPILEQLKDKYRGRAAILFVDVAKDKDMARKFNIRAIPTQIFFDKTGQEVWRHAGFLEKKIITKKINSMLQ